MKNSVKYKGNLKAWWQWSLVFAVLLAVMDGVILAVNLKAGMIALGFSIGYLLFLLGLYYYYKNRIISEMIRFAAGYAQVQNNILHHFAVPYGLLDSNGILIWASDQMEELLKVDKNWKKKISNFFPELTKDVFPKDENLVSLDLQKEKNHYRAEIRKISVEELMNSSSLLETSIEENTIYAIYLFDTTELLKCRQLIKEEKPVVALVYIDNYDEALQSVEEVRQSLLIALLERKINRYFHAIDGLIKRLEKDKYIVIINQKNLTCMEEKRFPLLEEVKTVNVGNEMSLTLSIGVGVDGGSYLANAELASTAMELALGRGGDQAVVKSKNDISYYGGKSQRMEKNTRVKARVKAHALHEIMMRKERVVIMGHRNMDMDCLGAAVGLYRAARVLEKDAYIVTGTVNGSMTPWMELYQEKEVYGDIFISHERAEEMVDRQTVLIVVDTNRPSMTECSTLLDNKADSVVVLDHHRQGSEKIEQAVLSYIEPYASSASEMVAEILQYFEETVRLRSNEADCIYAGIVVDTNNFMAKTGVRTFEAAAYLRRSGADVTRVRKLFRNSMDTFKARAEVVRRAEVFKDCYAISELPSMEFELNNPTVVGAQAANELLNITGIKASFVLTDCKDAIYISARAIDEVNVQIIMERLGGGGHLNIAGAQLKESSLEAARKVLKELITTMIEEGAI